MFGKEAYLGSLSLKSQVTMAGKLTSIVSNPSSISLTISILLSFKLTFELKVACGQLSIEASIWPV